MGRERKLTLISAPAGFGKTTLLVDWLKKRGCRSAWISIEENDNNPIRFLSAVAAACNTVMPRIGTDALRLLHTLQTPPFDKVIESILQGIVKAQTSFLLIFDDFHLIRNPRTQELLACFIEHVPDTVPLYITTRIDPALPLAKLRAQNRLVEIRAEELRFTNTEAACFLSDVMHLELSDDDIHILERRTEGWAAGLQMAGLSLQRQRNRASFIKNFNGSHRYIMDYLVEEVLQGLSAETRNFLLKTSILDRICGPLADELTGEKSSQRILEELERDNIFLLALDETRTWYRYHHLFSELLQHRLSLSYSDTKIAALHVKAGAWLEDHGDIERGMHHYLESKNYTEVFRLLDEQIEKTLSSGGLGLLLAWKDRIPQDATVDHADACVNLGVISAFAGLADDTEHYFSRAEEILEREKDTFNTEKSRRLRGQLCVMRAFIANIAGDTEAALQLAEAAEQLIPGERAMTRSLIPYILSRIYRHKGDLQRSEAYLRQQIELALLARNTWSLSGAIHEMIWICRLTGSLNKAEQILQKYNPYFENQANRGPIAKIIAVRAEILRERGRLEEASQIAAEALHSVEGWGLPSDVCFCLQTKLRIELSDRRAEAALQTIKRIDEITSTEPVHASILPLYEAERIRIFIALGMLGEAVSRLNNYRIDYDNAVINREVIDIARARLHIASGKRKEAASLLAALAHEAEAGGRGGRLIEILILQSAANDGTTADRALARALELAGPQGYVQVLLDEGDRMRRHLQEVPEKPELFSPQATDYAGRLLFRRYV